MHRIELPDWAVERGRGYNSFDAIDPERTALVVIDMQTAFVAEEGVFGKESARAIVEPINTLVRAMRDAGACVIWTRQTVSDAPHLAVPAWQYDLADPFVARAVASLRSGTAAHEIYPPMACGRDDLVLDKFRYGAFSCPAGALARVLHMRGIELIVLVGTLTNVCVESTAREANMRGHKVIVVADACAAATDAEHNAALLNLRLNFADVQWTRDILALLQEPDRHLPLLG
ncbi:MULTISPECIES: cysteine hydrolase family protein [Novosphingobium]|uniref:Isochorismatase hydrolase n=1 Tax=Novosphingobium pentaromativorans US6-1 TaxID=1088721 RepID=G6EED8_9SPHN|nr:MULTISPECIES: cysteine hydrolase [Novosphingobium]AIT79469.1 isochorismatase [Novosphingobium pentaromativorans US6-1]EHJ60361.1 isochorismatase hydrolase [Novosphingobium pentaromativorans US6-1]GFM27489.1 isochorismatase hydrolase [Novosphingobium sp. PY1]CCA91998.1 isochorismatase hydrolase [Novosphingobium sp. PP1Y]